MNLRAVRKFNKKIMHTNMDAMACSMDCREKLDVIKRIADLAVRDIDKTLQYAKENNQAIEGQLKLFRIKKKTLPVLESA